MNIKNNYQRCSSWCHVRHINSVKYIQRELRKRIKSLLMILIMMGLGFLFENNNICTNVYCYENKLTFPVYISDQKFEKSMDLLLVIDENKTDYVYIKDFYRFMFHKTKNKSEKYFCKSRLQCFSGKNVLTEHKEVCLSINVAQSVRLEK